MAINNPLSGCLDSLPVAQNQESHSETSYMRVSLRVVAPAVLYSL